MSSPSPVSGAPVPLPWDQLDDAGKQKSIRDTVDQATRKAAEVAKPYVQQAIAYASVEGTSAAVNSAAASCPTLAPVASSVNMIPKQAARTVITASTDPLAAKSTEIACASMGSSVKKLGEKSVDSISSW